MTVRDMIRVSVGNLRRMKLRTFLTVSGVVIAIGAFVSMLSLGAGNQRLIAEQYEELGLFTTMIVYPAEDGEGAGRPDGNGIGGTAAGGLRPLDADAVAELSGLPGVKLAYPYEDFDVTLAFGDSVISTGAQAMPPGAENAPLFSRLAAGGALAADDGDGALVLEEVLDEIGVEDPDSIVGKPIVVSVRSVSPDSGFARLLRDTEGMRRRWEEADADSMGSRTYVGRYFRRELQDAARRFLDGYLHAQRELPETLTVRGVLRGGDRRSNLRSVVLPLRTAERFHAAGPGGDPTELVPALLSGRLFGGEEGDGAGPRSYRQVTLLLETYTSHAAIVDSVEAHGFRAFSYAAQFDEIRRALLFFNLGLAAVGLVALATAALGIVNTLMMSVSERRREIGILKSLGAEDRHVRFLFLVESAVIGFAGSILGVLLGWGVARIGSAVAKEIMRRQDVPPIDVFATPPWLVLTAIAFGTVVAVVSGSLPAARAARVDPVKALRSD